MIHLMAAYSAVISLLQALDQFEERFSQILSKAPDEMFYSFYATAEYFQKVLDEVSYKSYRFPDPEKIESLEEKIRVSASDAEDIVELETCQIMEGSRFKYGVDWLPVVEKLDTTKKEAMEIVSDFSMITSNAIDDEILESGNSLIGTSSASNIQMPNLEDDIVRGLDDDLETIVERLKGPSSDLDIVTITGMGGIGKTTLARKAHDHLAISYQKIGSEADDQKDCWEDCCLVFRWRLAEKRRRANKGFLEMESNDV